MSELALILLLLATPGAAHSTPTPVAKSVAAPAAPTAAGKPARAPAPARQPPPAGAKP